ncbi:late cornified envelope protein 3D-like [Vombatus ursinus]|uniref:late cornified envelope protein 3D-like n=1 Tax=Vombatus ursinus TaxID=29139 RepID=UPI000FFD97E1|nr:late cornified envelope protein 3D-like [Vombatus ursinus]XP_027717270.1 late cornified envelope protein 3D-like [Vombatus ursinus]
MSYQQNQQQYQPPPKCQTPKYPPQAPCAPPVSSGCGSSSGGYCGSSSGGCSSSGFGGGCSLFSHHRRSNRCRRQSPSRCDSGCGRSQQSGDCGGSSGGCC